MRSFTWPFEAWSQRCASSFRRSCQVEPCGASVPSLIVTCADAAGASAASSAARTSFFTWISFGSEEQVVGVREEGLRAALGEDVGESEARHLARIRAQDLPEDARELVPVLSLDEHALREGDARAELLVHRDRRHTLEVRAHALRPAALGGAARRVVHDEELVDGAVIPALVER